MNPAFTALHHHHWSVSCQARVAGERKGWLLIGCCWSLRTHVDDFHQREWDEIGGRGQLLLDDRRHDERLRNAELICAQHHKDEHSTMSSAAPPLELSTFETAEGCAAVQSVGVHATKAEAAAFCSAESPEVRRVW